MSPAAFSGTVEERGIGKLNRGSGDSAADLKGMQSYDLPFGMDFIRRHPIFTHIPISPTFTGYKWGRLLGGCRSRMGHRETGKGGEGSTAPGESGV